MLDPQVVLHSCWQDDSADDPRSTCSHRAAEVIELVATLDRADDYMITQRAVQKHVTSICWSSAYDRATTMTARPRRARLHGARQELNHAKGEPTHHRDAGERHRLTPARSIAAAEPWEEPSRKSPRQGVAMKTVLLHHQPSPATAREPARNASRGRITGLALIAFLHARPRLSPLLRRLEAGAGALESRIPVG